MATKKTEIEKIEIGSSLSIDTAKDLKLLFDAKLKKAKKLSINSKEGLSDLDLTGVQLLYYYQKQAQKLNKELSFNLKISTELAQIIQKSGLSDIMQNSI